jgi:hypothetical protein
LHWISTCPCVADRGDRHDWCCLCWDSFYVPGPLRTECWSVHADGHGLEDLLLLREFAESRSDQAFAELVGQHVDLVYSTAVRLVRDQRLAGNVVQMVFLDLARKAKSLPANIILIGWLYRNTRCASLNALRLERRGQNHNGRVDPPPAKSSEIFVGL